MKKNIILGSAMLFATLIAGGCGSINDKTISTASGTKGTIVDPYIEGAVLCEDVNNSYTCDAGEQLSTASNANGEFTFGNALTAGSYVIIKTQGKHNGVTYDLNISGLVDSDGSIDVISPLTTLQTRGLTSTEIGTMLTAAGLSGFDATTLLDDPMSGGLKDKKLSDFTGSTSFAQDLANLHASLATYGLLRVMEGSDTLRELSGTELVAAGLDGGAVNEILTVMVENITSALSYTNLQTINGTIEIAQTSAGGYSNLIPDVTLDTVIKTAVAILDRLTEIGYTTCNATNGTDTEKVTAALSAVEAASSAVAANASALGQMFYGKENKTSLQTIAAYLPANVAAGVACTKETYIINSDNAIESYSE